jgi:hypothetical protein
MKPLAWLQVAFGLFGLIAQVALAGSLVAAGLGTILLASSLNILAIVAGALLLRQARAGALTSFVLWGVQTVQVLTPQFVFEFLLGPYFRIRFLASRLTWSLGASLSAALGSPPRIFATPQREISVNLLALLVLVYLFRRSRRLFRGPTPPVAGSPTSA